MKFLVEAGHIAIFARAVGDPNPIYCDDGYAANSDIGHVIAPPTFVRASAQFDPDYPLRPKIGEPWIGSGREPSGTAGTRTGNGPNQGTGLHAEQHFEYHRHVRPGDLLTLTERPGESWEREGRRGGALQFRETIVEYRDGLGGLVVTARSVVVRTSKPVSSE